MKDSENTWVLIEHPDLDNEPVLVTMHAFDTLHKSKGWKRVKEVAPEVRESAPRDSTAAKSSTKKSTSKSKSSKE